MLIGNLPEDTSLSENGYIPYSEDGQHLFKIKVKDFVGGGAGLKYWKETENTLYRVQHNEGQWLFDDFFKVPGAAEIIVGATYWDFREGGADHDSSDPILVGHEDPETHEIYYTEEDGPEVAVLQDRVKHYYIFRRLSNKVVMGGVLYYKYWNGAANSRLADEGYNNQSRYTFNLPGWLLMSTDRDSLTYQLVEIDPWSYDQMPASVQQRIDDGFFRYEHASDRVISTIAPLDTPYTHAASGAVFFVNGVPDPELYEPITIIADSQQGYDTKFVVKWAYTPPSGLDPTAYPYGDTLNIYDAEGYYLDNAGIVETPVTSGGGSWPNRANWVNSSIYDPWGSNHSAYDKLSNVRLASFDSRAYDVAGRAAVTPTDIKGPYLAYFGAVYDISSFQYTDLWGKDAIEYPFHDGNIQYPQGYFTGIATGFATRGKVLYSGVTTDDYDTPQVDNANFWVDGDGNIAGESLSVRGEITSNGVPVIGNITPLLSQGTKIANIYRTGDSEPTGLYAPSGGSGGGSIEVTATRIWNNPKSGYQAQVSSLTMDYDPGNYDILVIDYRDAYNDASRSFKYYVFMDCTSFLDSGSVDAVGTDSNNYVSFLNPIAAGRRQYSLSYGGYAFIKQIIGINLTAV